MRALSALEGSGKRRESCVSPTDAPADALSDYLSDDASSTGVPDSPRCSLSVSTPSISPKYPANRSQSCFSPLIRPSLFKSGLLQLELGLQDSHDHPNTGRAAWEPPAFPPVLRQVSLGSASQSSTFTSLSGRAGNAAAGQAHDMHSERSGEPLNDNAGKRVVFRPKQAHGVQSKTTAAGQQRVPDFCARAEPESLCFCGHTFSDHTPDARVGRRCAGRRRSAMMGLPGLSSAEEREFGTQACCHFRYMPPPAQSSRDAPASARGGRLGVTCLMCGCDVSEHDAVTEACPMAYNKNIGKGRFHAAWACAVCGLRWEDHETAPETASRLFDGGSEAAAGASSCKVQARRKSAGDTATGTDARRKSSAGQWGHPAADRGSLRVEADQHAERRSWRAEAFGASYHYKHPPSHNPVDLRAHIQCTSNVFQDQDERKNRRSIFKPMHI
mmetsp:Transcript_93372/g.264320  ORF Transcript_93372/g.264320 Transcript_93372/m.264320 type:complete len:443 (+) Transcript_93372:64-1392(+)